MYDECLATAIEAARTGGRILQEWSAKFTAREKSPKNLVTEADLASEEAIGQIIDARFPSHGILGEEGLDRVGTDPAWRWIVDPLDGTSNYVHRFPYYAVSIGLEHEGKLVVGVIFDPTRDELFSAVHGQGAKLNDQPITPTPTSVLREAMMVASLPVASGADDPAVGRFLTIMPHVQTVQRTGSAALNLAYVACGRIDGFWSTSLKPWDMAAGALIVREAGGRVSQIGGNDFAVETPDLLATNGSAIHEGLVQQFT